MSDLIAFAFAAASSHAATASASPWLWQLQRSQSHGRGPFGPTIFAQASIASFRVLWISSTMLFSSSVIVGSYALAPVFALIDQIAIDISQRLERV
jgi:hypothetical protein